MYSRQILNRNLSIKLKNKIKSFFSKMYFDNDFPIWRSKNDVLLTFRKRVLNPYQKREFSINESTCEFLFSI